MRESGVSARGIDLNEESVSRCRNNGLHAEQADIFEYLAALPDQSVGGMFCAQVIEHLQPAQVLTLVQLSARKLQHGAPIVFETPNPECLAIFATHFYIDPTHVRPVPPTLMAFYLEEAGLAQIEVSRFSPAAETMPSLEKLPSEFRQEFFDGLLTAFRPSRVSRGNTHRLGSRHTHSVSRNGGLPLPSAGIGSGKCVQPTNHFPLVTQRQNQCPLI